jgi:hypothetical protein
MFISSHRGLPANSSLHWPAGVMDRHNMMLFLQNDTIKEHPAGFEVTRRNIFDPEEDPVGMAKLEGNASSVPDTGKQMEVALSSMKGIVTSNFMENNVREGLGNNKDVNTTQVCSRLGCKRKPRFDSIFCSDSCGVSTLETDLLRTLQYASKIHPSVFSK